MGRLNSYKKIAYLGLDNFKVVYKGNDGKILFAFFFFILK